ncbi:MAG: sialate O-acetylesterase [Sphingopyxis sp.]
MICRFLLCAALLFAPLAASAQEALALGAPFSDHMVLQQGRAIAVWGTGRSGDRVDVALGEAVASAIVGADGNWRAELSAMSAQHGLTMRVRAASGSAITVNDVAVGDVWLCSGQSNMEFEVAQATNADSELANSSDADLRLLLVPRGRSHQPQSQFSNPAHWASSDAQSAAHFSAACYHLGRELRARLHIPIGLIAASWGGSRIEDWLSRRRLMALGGYEADLAALDAHQRDPAAADVVALLRLESWITRNAPPADAARFAGGPARGTWEQWGEAALASFDGVARYTATITMTRAQAAAARTLALGTIDDIDVTQVNGQLVGMTTGWNVPRNYTLSPGALHAGVNSISVTVLDTGGGGGLYGNGPRGIILADGSIVALNAGWGLDVGASIEESGPPPIAPWANGEGLATLDQAMIAPLGNYAVAGYAWYQGESNAARAALYPAQLSALIADWRARFGGSRFLVVGLASFGRMADAPRRSHWAELREAQRRVAHDMPDVALVPAIDIGDVYDIHPTNKREVGRRLALAAVAAVPPTAPNPLARRVADGVELHFAQSYRLLGGVTSPTGLEACDKAGQCRFVTARLVAPDRLLVAVSPDDSELRYLWADSALVSLFDARGIPLPPFRIAMTP